MSTLVLASSSPYRKALLDRLGLKYESCSPDIDETAHNNETPEQLVQRLALAKAQAVAEHYPNSLVIGSDQVAVLDQKIITKPHNLNAIAQLTEASGRCVKFLTSLCLYNQKTQQHQLSLVNYSVKFLPLSASMLEAHGVKNNRINVQAASNQKVWEDFV